MRVTVCELNDTSPEFARDWEKLAEHVRREKSDLVLLPEMPFAPWLAAQRQFDAAMWRSAVEAHERWLQRLGELAPAGVVGTRPVTREGKRLNEGFVWDIAEGYRIAHLKYYLPDDEGFWEASWYGRGDGVFAPQHIGDVRLGFLICTELWFMEWARAYGKAGAHLLVIPRCTGKPTLEKWLTGGRAAAVISGAYVLSSNRFSPRADFGGQGWVIDPDGAVLGVTSQAQPFLTFEIDPQRAEAAKRTYPRYVQA